MAKAYRFANGLVLNPLGFYVPDEPVNKAPTAVFQLAADFLEVVADAGNSTDIDGSIVSYTWNWGDGTSNSTGITATHVYGTAGTKTITLTIADNEGLTATASQTATLSQDGSVDVGDKPGPSNTGLKAGWTEAMLTRTGTPGGSRTITTDNTIIENQYCRDRIIIQAKNCIIRNCVLEYPAFTNTGSGIILCNSKSNVNLIVEDCVIRVHKDFTWWGLNAIYGINFTIRRCNMYHVTDGFGVATGGSTATVASNVLVERNWIHDLAYIYWPSSYATSGNNGGPFTDYRSKPEEHGDFHTHNDDGQLHWGLGTRIEYNTLDGFVDPTVGTIPFYTSSTPGATGVPGLTAAEIKTSFRMPYDTTGYQATGQCILMQVAQGTTISMNCKGNWIDGSVVGLNFYGLKGGPNNFNAGSAVDNLFGRNTRAIGGVKDAIRKTTELTVVFSNNLYEDTKTPVTVKLQSAA